MIKCCYVPPFNKGGILLFIKHFVWLILITPSICFTQQFGQRIVINDNQSNLRKAILADFDNDGHLDIGTSASNIVSWYKNLDGLGNFSDPIPIQLNQGQSFDISVADINSNGHLDVIVTFFDNDFVAWYPNDGFGNFGSGNIVASGLNNTRSATPVDMNNDGKTDLVIGISNGNGFYWAQNNIPFSTVWTLNTIDPLPSQARKQIAADIDNDGDIDIFTRISGAEFYWYENLDGQGQNWNQQFIESNIGESYQFIDLDGDGLKDILAVSNNEQVLWLKNLDGQGNFSPVQIIHAETNNIRYSQVNAFDINNNGHIDVVASTSNVLIENNKLVWFENVDGFGNFGPPQIIDTHTQFITSIVGSDLDNDGYNDIVVTLTGPDVRGLFWYKNNGILNTPGFELSNVNISPNPVSNILNIDSKTTINKATFYNTLGQTVLTVKDNMESIDISHLSKGLYFLEIKAGITKSTLKLIKK